MVLYEDKDGEWKEDKKDGQGNYIFSDGMSNADELHWEARQSKRIIKKYETNTPGSDDDECRISFI